MPCRKASRAVRDEDPEQGYAQQRKPKVAMRWQQLWKQAEKRQRGNTRGAPPCTSFPSTQPHSTGPPCCLSSPLRPAPPWLSAPLSQGLKLFLPVPCTKGSVHRFPPSFYLPPQILKVISLSIQPTPIYSSASHSLSPFLRGTLMLPAFLHILSVPMYPSHHSDPLSLCLAPWNQINNLDAI